MNLARLLGAVDIRAGVDEDGRRAGELLGLTGTVHPVDATVVLLAARVVLGCRE